MTEPRTCARCGGPLPADGGTCPRCLLRLGLDLPPRDPAATQPAGAPGAAPTQAPPSSRPAPLPLEEVARRFPALQITALIGQGGMGMVYRARQPRLDREVALKVLPPELSSDPAFAERFLREARAMARLAHPNIVAVHDFGETDGVCWLLMELVDGVNLRQALRTGALPPEKALAVVPQMCDALQYAHDEGVVHRDIKPENVLLDRAGRVKIADFGLAKLLGPQDVTLTTETQVFGTPHYMAPEQMEGARDVDHRADIFSLGVVFYEMLTGRLPVGRFEPPSRRVAIDVRLDDVVLHALEHEPERRYQHASEVKTDMESVAAGNEPGVAHAEHGPFAAAGAPPAKKLHGFAGVWLEWPKKKGEPAKVRAGAGNTTGGQRGVQPGQFVWGTRIRVRGLLTGLALVAACALAWRIAGGAAAQGRDGAIAGLALLVATAVGCLFVCMRQSPALVESLRAESSSGWWLRGAAAVVAAAAGLTLMGEAVVEGWEHGTRHYISDARDPVSWRLEGDVVPASQGGAALPPSGEWSTLSTEGAESPPNELTAAASWALGGLLLLGFGLAVVLRPSDPRAARAGFAVALAVPAVMLLGLGLLAVWTDLAHPANAWPDLVAVRGEVQVPLDPHAAAIAVNAALRLERYAVQSDQPFFVHDGPEPHVIEEHIALEPSTPQDRWSLEDGLPRRRRPHVTLRIHRVVGDEHACLVDWDCGHVRPVAAEPALWSGWIEHILKDAPRFNGTAAGG